MEYKSRSNTILMCQAFSSALLFSVLSKANKRYDMDVKNESNVKSTINMMVWHGLACSGVYTYHHLLVSFCFVINSNFFLFIYCVCECVWAARHVCHVKYPHKNRWMCTIYTIQTHRHIGELTTLSYSQSVSQSLNTCTHANSLPRTHASMLSVYTHKNGYIHTITLSTVLS